MTDCFIQIFRRFMFWTPSSIFIEEMHEIREQLRNHALVMHYNNSGKLYFHYLEPIINSDP